MTRRDHLWPTTSNSASVVFVQVTAIFNGDTLSPRAASSEGFRSASTSEVGECAPALHLAADQSKGTWPPTPFAAGQSDDSHVNIAQQGEVPG
jgi:hypothetical protein